MAAERMIRSAEIVKSWVLEKYRTKTIEKKSAIRQKHSLVWQWQNKAAMEIEIHDRSLSICYKPW